MILFCTQYLASIFVLSIVLYVLYFLTCCKNNNKKHIHSLKKQIVVVFHKNIGFIKQGLCHQFKSRTAYSRAYALIKQVPSAIQALMKICLNRIQDSTLGEALWCALPIGSFIYILILLFFNPIYMG